ncbi:MAG: PrsW family intramembrane metalloprotease [Niastella sp.]|nr:PrsW family intramembrane metalloprotease [Niastella sp.]
MAEKGKFSPHGIREGFSDLIGLEELQDFKLGNVFSEVFKKHTTEEMEDQLITGTSRHTPSLSEIEIGWAKPWLFARLLGISVVLAIVFYVSYDMFRNVNLVPGLIFVGSFAVPLSVLLFYLEMNVPRNVSIFMVMQLLFVGGVASLLVTLLLSERLGFFYSYLGASAAGIIEETAKILIVIWFTAKAGRYRWILNGLLFGAAVGTGFGAFETAGYAFRDMLQYGVDTGVSTIVMRGLQAPCTHIVWTANVAAALWLVKKDRPFSWDMLQQPAFLRIAISSVVLHMLWNAPFNIMPLPLHLDVKDLLLGGIGWIICLRLIQTGLKQLNQARQADMPGA